MPARGLWGGASPSYSPTRAAAWNIVIHMHRKEGLFARMYVYVFIDCTALLCCLDEARLHPL